MREIERNEGENLFLIMNIIDLSLCRSQSDWSGESALPCGYKPTTDDNQPLVRTIYISTMAFVQQVAPESYARRRNERWFHVCYSFHSSYGELREVIFFLRPHHAYPNVIPMGDTMPQVGAGVKLTFSPSSSRLS